MSWDRWNGVLFEVTSCLGLKKCVADIKEDVGHFTIISTMSLFRESSKQLMHFYKGEIIK